MGENSFLQFYTDRHGFLKSRKVDKRTESIDKALTDFFGEEKMEVKADLTGFSLEAIEAEYFFRIGVKDSLEFELKRAEINKVIAETEKVAAETERIETETEIIRQA